VLIQLTFIICASHYCDGVHAVQLVMCHNTVMFKYPFIWKQPMVAI
jgi:hypothetical protein